MILVAALGMALALGLTACAVEFQNRQPAQEVKQRAKPVDSVYAGWRVYQDRCAACHGADAAGTARAADLRQTLRQMGPRRFVSVVLVRYDWPLQAGQARGEGAAREALIDEVEQRRQGSLAMPAWQGEPEVQAHILDLYAYLSARSDGTLGPGRPQR